MLEILIVIGLSIMFIMWLSNTFGRTPRTKMTPRDHFEEGERLLDMYDREPSRRRKRDLLDAARRHAEEGQMKLLMKYERNNDSPNNNQRGRS